MKVKVKVYHDKSRRLKGETESWASIIPLTIGTTKMADCSNPTRTTVIHLKRITSTNCCIHTVVPPDDGPRYARNMYRLTKYTKNKLCFKLVFLYTSVTSPLYIYCPGKSILRDICREKLIRIHQSAGELYLEL